MELKQKLIREAQKLDELESINEGLILNNIYYNLYYTISEKRMYKHRDIRSRSVCVKVFKIC